MKNSPIILNGNITIDSVTDTYRIEQVGVRFNVTSRKGIDYMGNGHEGFKTIPAAIKAIMDSVSEDQKEYDYGNKAA